MPPSLAFDARTVDTFFVALIHKPDDAVRFV
jgi:hypothetical protein